MSVEPAPAEVIADSVVQDEIERVRASAALGRAGRLRDLFEFMVERSRDGAPPKEAEIAASVFGKAQGAQMEDDSMVRVYVHRLRRKLDDHYRQNGAPHGLRLEVPKGEYRILASRVATAGLLTPLAHAWRHARGWASGRPFSTLAALLVMLNLAAWVVIASPDSPARDEAASLPVWSALAEGDGPVMIVVGDYYLFGEFDEGGDLKRLVRDFSVNSRDDLTERLMYEPEAWSHFGDVDLGYLPTSVAQALNDVRGAIPPTRDVRVVLASEVSANTLKHLDVVYVGLASGLGSLRDLVFAGSRYAIGRDYDQFIDKQTGDRFISEAFSTLPYGGIYRDYGYFAMLRGLSGNRLVVIAGARDTGLLGVAESVTDAAAVQALHDAAGRAEAFDALFEIRGQGNINLDSAPLTVAVRRQTAERLVDAGAVSSSSE